LKILVIDDHPLIREAVRNVLGRLGESIVALEAADCDCALSIVDEHPDLDLILLDLGLPGTSGMDALGMLRERHPAVPVVVLSASDDRDTVVEALDRGAMGFIPKSSSNEIMLNALRLVLSGGVYLPPKVFISNHATLPAPMPVANLGLTERQLQVLVLMVQGKPNKLICRELGLAESTVKIHVTAILKALHVTSRTQAVIAVGRMGIKLDGIVQALPPRLDV
jgi:DNA-binding NarL/FixJ family response regulator